MSDSWIKIDKKNREAIILRRPNGFHTYLLLRELRKQGYSVIEADERKLL
jgi:hypothetical protein